MNSYMNITVRVLTKQATAMLAALEAELKSTNRTANGMTMGAGAFNAASRSIRAFGASLQWAAYQLTHAFTYPLLLAGGAALKYELDNERAFAQLKKVYGDTALAIHIGTDGINRELAALRQEFIALSNVYGQSQTDVLNIAQAWAAAGVSGRALGRAVEDTMKTMVIGDINATEATKALISIQAQFGASTEGLTKILAALNVTENITAASMQDLITGFSNSASTAAASGIDYKHLAALIAALVPASGSAAKAGNALKTLFTRILVPTARATDLMTQMGIAVDGQSWLALTAAQRMEVLAKKWKDLDGNQRAYISDAIAGKFRLTQFNQAMADIGKSFDAQGKLLPDNSDKLGNYGKVLAGTKDDIVNAKVAQQELQTVLESNPQRLKQMWTIIKNEAGTTIAKLIPVILVMVNAVTRLVKWFASLSPQVQKFFGILAVGLALMGPLLFYVAAFGRLFGLFGAAGRMAKDGATWLKKAWTGQLAREQEQAAALKAKEKAAKATATKAVAEAETAIAKTESVATSSAARTAEVAAAAARSGAQAFAVAEYEKTTVAAAEAAKRDRVAALEAAKIAEYYQIAARKTAATYGLSSGIIQDELGAIAVAAAAANTAVAETSTAAAAEMTTVYVAGAAGIEAALVEVGVIQAQIARQQALLAAAAAAEAAAAEAASAAKITAMLEEVAVMRGTMKARLLLTDGWTAAGLLEAASVDQVTARLLIQLQALRALQAQALLTSKRMIETSAAANLPAVIPTANRAAVATNAAGAGGTVLLGSRVVGAAEQATKKSEGIFKRSFGKISVWAAATFGGVGKSITKGLGAATGAVSKFSAGFWRVLTKLPLIGFIFSGIGKAAMVLAGAIGVSGGVIAAIIIGIIAIFLLFRNKITSSIRDAIDSMVNLAKRIWDVMKSVGNFIAGGVRLIISAITALPRAFATVFKGVVDIVARAARNIYELFSYLNPFARHSPSLVENVTRGMDIIARKFAGITAISVPIRRAYVEIKTFGKAIAGLIARQEELKRQEDITSLRDAGAANAIPSYLRLSAVLKELTGYYKRLGDALSSQQMIVDAYQKQVDSLTEALDAQKEKLSDLQAAQQKYADLLQGAKDKINEYANTGIAGMRAMSDAIFDNEMAQKKLQLQMMQMEDAIGPIDKIQDKLAKLAGDIETLRGEQTDLRKAGAGSDILKTYDDQIKALEDQADATKVQTKQYDDMAAALEKLQREGEKLNLEQSLQFDPLTRQIDQLVNGLNEIPFEDIIAGIKKSQTEVDKYTKAYDKATDAVNAQQAVVDKAQRSHDVMQKTLDTEQKKLQDIRSVYDRVGDSISSVTDALSQMTSAAQDVTRALKDAAGAAGGIDLNALDAGLGDAGGADVLGRVGGLDEQTDQIMKDMQDALDKLKGSFDKIDPFGGIKDKFKEFGAWVKKWFWDEPAKWGDWFLNNTGPLGDAVSLLIDLAIKGPFAASDVFNYVKKWGGKLVGFIWDGLSSAGKVIGGFFADLWGWITDGLGSGLDTLSEFFSNLPGWILDFFKDAGKWLANAGKDIMHGLGYGLGFALGTVGKFFIDLPKNMLKWTRNAVNWLKTTGVSTIVGLINGMASMLMRLGQWFIELPTNILGWVSGAGTWLFSTGTDLLSGLLDGIAQGLIAVANWFVNFPEVLLSFFVDAGTWLYDVGGDILTGLWNGLVATVKTIWDWIKSFVNGFIEGFKNALGIKSPSTVFFGIAVDIIQGLLNGLISAAKAVFQWFMDLPGRILGIIGNAAAWLIQKGQDIITGIITGIGNFAGKVWQWFKDLPGTIKSIMGDTMTWLVEKGLKIINGLFLGIAQYAEDVWAWFRGMPERIKNFFGNAITWLVDAGKAIIQGLWNGMKQIWGGGAGGLSGWIGGLAGAIMSLKGPLDYDRKILIPAGDAIMQGLHEGLADGWKPVKAMLSGLAPEIANGFNAGAFIDSASRLINNGARDSVFAKLAANAQAEPASLTNTTYNDNRTIHFHGDLSFPNIKSSGDAEEFLRNLETLAGR